MFVSTPKVQKMRQIMIAQTGKCSKQGDYVRVFIGSIQVEKVSERTRKVQNVRQLITQIRQEVFPKGVLSAGSIYLYEL